MNGPPGQLVDPTLLVAQALERLGALYFLVGSVASSLQGEPRATNDIDFVARLSEAQVPALAQELGPDFSVDEEALIEAVRRRSSWNLYYLPLVTKVDLFVADDSEFEASEFARRRLATLGEGAQLYVASPEDNVLFKLRWYLKGERASGSQWRDVVGVLRISGAVMDPDYLDEWAGRLGLTELLGKARTDAGAARPTLSGPS